MSIAMEAINIAENQDMLFIMLDKTKISTEDRRKIELLLQSFQKDDSSIEFVHDDEQKELEEIIENMTEDDKEIVHEEILSIEI